jgi:HD-GYP domain-containing protein (c-di-GMP phosphodiesterase class II)
MIGVGSTLTLLLCLILALRPAPLPRLSNAVYDLQLSLLPRSAAAQLPLVVEIDDRSIKALGQWPWPRHRVAQLLSKLAAAGVAAVGVDLLFSEPDRTSPVMIQRALQDETGVTVSLAGIPARHRDHDEMLAAALSGGPFVLSYFLDFRDAATGGCVPRAANIALLVHGAPHQGRASLPRAKGILCNLRPLSDAVQATGFVNGQPDDDGVYRRTPLLIEHRGRVLPSLGLQTLMTAAGLHQALLESHADGWTLHLGSRRIPLDAAGSLLLRFPGPEHPIEIISAIDILAGRIDPQHLRGRIAFVGASATGLREFRPTPLDPLFTGTELHAAVVDNILQGDLLAAAPFAGITELASALITGLVLSLLMAWVGPTAMAALALLTPVAAVVTSQLMLSLSGIAISPLPSSLCASLVLIATNLLKYWLQLARMKAVNRHVLLGQEATLAGFAALAEYRDPETGGHLKRTQCYVKVLAQSLQRHPKYWGRLDDAGIELMLKTAPLHDIGKIAVPDHVLLKPGRLTPREFDIMKRHTEFGAAVISVIKTRIGENDFLRTAHEIILYHHEKWDGSGYPQGIAGDAIPLAARLMAVADVYDALISERIYKAAYSHLQALHIILGKSGTHFDPDVVDAFLAVADQFQEIALQLTDSEAQRSSLLLPDEIPQVA